MIQNDLGVRRAGHGLLSWDAAISRQGRPFYCLLSLRPLVRFSALVSWVMVAHCTQPEAASLTLSAPFFLVPHRKAGWSQMPCSLAV